MLVKMEQLKKKISILKQQKLPSEKEEGQLDENRSLLSESFKQSLVSGRKRGSFMVSSFLGDYPGASELRSILPSLHNRQVDASQIMLSSHNFSSYMPPSRRDGLSYRGSVAQPIAQSYRGDAESAEISNLMNTQSIYPIKFTHNDLSPKLRAALNQASSIDY